MKLQRQEALIEIISSRVVDTQEELKDSLEKLGFSATQATVSRDIRELGIKKQPVDGVLRYTIHKQRKTATVVGATLFTEHLLSATPAQNIVVLKTNPGLAMAVCTELDTMAISGIVGTLAGDDTCFIVMKDNHTAKTFCKSLKEQLDLKNR